MKKTAQKYYKQAKKASQSSQKKASSFISKHPVLTFVVLLLTLLLLIVAGNFIRNDEDVTTSDTPPKQVSVHRVGESAKYITKTKLEKSQVTTVVAQMPGIVSQIYKNTGESVTKGQSIIATSTNYQGGNAAALQTQIASAQKKLFDETYQVNLDVISRQIDLANQNFENSDELRQITKNSISASQNLLDLNQDILSTINQNLDNLENATDSANNQELILATKQLKSQYQSVVNQLEVTIDNQKYATDPDNPPQEIQENQREVALKQLEIQQKALDINGEITNLQLQLAQVNQALMSPASPFTGIVQQVLVRIGQAVNPGTPIAIVSGNDQTTIAVAYVPKDVAHNINQLEPSTLFLPSGEYQTKPFFVSTEATTGNQYAVFYSLPPEFSTTITNDSYINVNIPIGYMDTSTSASFIPLDAVYQSANSNYIFTVSNDNTATAVEVELGSVFGSQVQIESGLEQGAEVIIDRSVIGSDPVQVIN